MSAASSPCPDLNLIHYKFNPLYKIARSSENFSDDLFSLHQPYRQAALSKPLWRSSASMLGSRPRKALKDSAALREPPTGAEIGRASCRDRV